MAFLRYVRIVARTTFAVVNNLYCIPAYVLWMMALRLVRPLYAPLYWKIEGLMYHWLLAMVSLWSWTAGYEIMETGDEPAACSGRRTLVLANHQSTADVPMLMSAWNPRPGVLPNLMWIMDRVFKFTNFGIVSVLHEDFFIQAGKAKRDQSLEELRQHIHRFYMPLGRQFMVLFPEGGFLHKRREVSQRFAEKNNLPKLEYVSLPRAGAMKVIMEEIGPRRDEGASTSKENAKKDDNFNKSPRTKMIIDNKVGDSIEWILDVTIAYPDRIPLHLQDVVCGIRPACTTHLHYRLYPSSEVPSDTEGMTQWLYDRFIEKDAMLEEFYKTGKFPSKGSGPYVVRQVRQDNLRYLILHSFFIASTFLQYNIFNALWSYFW
ncbi:acyl-CoA:lysophosphatidylglycerol acyltransferase 1-like isoform X2 [Manduca sexta]|uniref:acyl-CoA:lysophosphatidylglycerol acyltransferase 1-like isoform X2 n=1 Tax=Manduca sexta TaxID=7130 RepID=UPI0018902AB0|nr:acyl-CoA:lysophosphatidylglycerol acyltransferase 1-like isoform X2 [Manduca sexta]